MSPAKFRTAVIRTIDLISDADKSGCSPWPHLQGAVGNIVLS